MKCRDRSCRPDEGEAGCLASICNEGAFDALDFVWARVWDDCPVLRSATERAEADEFEQQQEDAALAQQERMLAAEGWFS